MPKPLLSLELEVDEEEVEAAVLVWAGAAAEVVAGLAVDSTGAATTATGVDELELDASSTLTTGAATTGAVDVTAAMLEEELEVEISLELGVAEVGGEGARPCCVLQAPASGTLTIWVVVETGLPAWST